MQKYLNDYDKVLGTVKPYTLSFHCVSAQVGNRDHNIRKIIDEDHIDKELIRPPVIDEGPFEEAHNNYFKTSIDNYNRDGRGKKIKNYYQEILETKNPQSDNKYRTAVYEAVAHIGNIDYSPDRKLCCKLLEEYFSKVFPKLYPNIHIINLTIHEDEITNGIYGCPHAHVDFIFVGHALTKEERAEYIEWREEATELYKKRCKENNEREDEGMLRKFLVKHMIEKYGKSLTKGPELQNSRNGALNEMGFYDEPKERGMRKFTKDVLHNTFPRFLEDNLIRTAPDLTPKHGNLSIDNLIKFASNDNVKFNKNLREAIFSYGRLHQHYLKSQKDLEEEKERLKTKENELTEKEKKINKENQALQDAKVDFNKKQELERKLSKMFTLRQTPILDYYKRMPKPISASDSENFIEYIDEYMTLVTMGYDYYKPLLSMIVDYTPEKLEKFADDIRKSNCNTLHEYYQMYLNYKHTDSKGRNIFDNAIDKLKNTNKSFVEFFLKQLPLYKFGQAEYLLEEHIEKSKNYNKEVGYSR